jgi:hypothetical protein
MRAVTEAARLLFLGGGLGGRRGEKHNPDPLCSARQSTLDYREVPEPTGVQFQRPPWDPRVEFPWRISSASSVWYASADEGDDMQGPPASDRAWSGQRRLAR